MPLTARVGGVDTNCNGWICGNRSMSTLAGADVSTLSLTVYVKEVWVMVSGSTGVPTGDCTPNALVEGVAKLFTKLLGKWPALSMLPS